MGDRRLEAALADMRRNDPDAAMLAEGMCEWVAGELGIDGFSLSRVQRFAWYDLSVKWMIPDAERWEVLEAGATLFDALELDRYASVVRSSQTANILTAHERSPAEGLKAFQKAFEASGIDPPDLEDLVWGDVSAPEENAAQRAISRALEEAMDNGSMTPGSRGWRATARAITTDVLDSDHPDIPGQSWRSVILTERIENSIRTLEDRSPELHAMLSDTVNRLLSPIPPPPDLDRHLSLVMWFLDYVGDGVKMTGAGFLPTAMVRDGVDRFGWDKGWSDDPPKKESDSMELGTLHQMLLDAGAVRHRKEFARRTTVGSRMLKDPEYAWRTIAGSLTPYPWLAAVAQVYTLLLLSGEDDDDALCDRAHTILVDYGFRAGDELPDRWDVYSAWVHVRRPLEALDGLSETDRYPSSKIVLNPFGEAMLLERLRLDITGPMRHP
jgi:hypothetical protein